MRADIILFFALVELALSGPVRRDCGEERCWDTVNECGMTYGGCWTECANGFKEMPTFTAPPCTDNAYAEPPVQASGTATDSPSIISGSTESLITPPPSLEMTTIPGVSVSSACEPLWLCVDYLAVCGDVSQMYGGCYDVCTSAPPVTSPPCSLSMTQSDYAIPTSSSLRTPGSAYTEEPASDSVSPAVDDSKALVMAEMPSAITSAPEPAVSTPAVEFRLASSNAAKPALVASKSVEAHANMRLAAIAKMEKDPVRQPNTENKPCWDSEMCKEVQLGISSTASSQAATETAAVSTVEASFTGPFTEALVAEPTESPA